MKTIEETLKCIETDAIPLGWGKHEAKQLAIEVRRLRERERVLVEVVRELIDPCKWPSVESLLLDKDSAALEAVKE